MEVEKIYQVIINLRESLFIITKRRTALVSGTSTEGILIIFSDVTMITNHTNTINKNV